MLSKVNRIVSPSDFRSVLRRGRRLTTSHTTIHFVRTGTEASRFGFIVSKATGNAVSRKHTTRWFREISRELLSVHPTGLDVVIRAKDSISETTWSQLHDEILTVVGRF